MRTLAGLAHALRGRELDSNRIARACLRRAPAPTPSADPELRTETAAPIPEDRPAAASNHGSDLSDPPSLGLRSQR